MKEIHFVYFCRMTYPWGDTRRFNSYARYFREKFGSRVQKLSVDAGFTCPNRDGSLGVGGCHFCNNDGFNPSYCTPSKPITRQINEGIEFHAWRYRKAVSYLAYFQAYSNTFAPIEHLKKIYQEALAHPEVIGLVIGTRPDCVNDEILDYLAELATDYHIQLEFGVESVYDETLLRINRGHDFKAATDALEAAKSRGLETGAHFIFGLPGETREMMLRGADVISELPLNTVKFHQLQILKNTRFEEIWLENPDYFQLFGFEDYVEFIIEFLERLNPTFVVERFAGEVPPRFQASPGWGMIRNEKIVSVIEKIMEQKDTFQGKLFSLHQDQ